MIKQVLDEKIRGVFGGDGSTGELFVNEPMKGHTTLRIGGPADLYVIPRNLVSMRNLMRTLKDEHIPFMPLGGGSNVVISDGGVEGAVIATTSFHHIELIEDHGDEIRLFAEAGATLQKLVNFCKAKGCTGMEGLAGIPGSVGGAIAGNSGSFGYEIGRVVESVTVIGREGKIMSLEDRSLSFAYRSSGIPDNMIILSAIMRLKADDPHDVARRVERFLQEKRHTQPVSQWSAGCVFKNPPQAAAGKLMDEAGCKGMVKGDIEVSTLHANFFVNKGSGRAADFLALMDEVRERVLKSSGIELEPEIRIVGRHGDR
ncbi:MAG TPA: UDP-N-acetylmuramate dehydrogenase [Thermodesulfovibrionales bacterium]|nr:UDP-N-acetylmuramate dehydrogenase [Thermodesulfovibrionales bacterium]